MPADERVRSGLILAMAHAPRADLEGLASLVGIADAWRFGTKARIAIEILNRLLAADAPKEGVPLVDLGAIREFLNRQVHGTEITGAYEAMMELSMYVMDEEWDSAQRHIRPASRRVSLEDAQTWTMAADRVSDAKRRVDTFPDYDYLDEEQGVINAR